MRTSGRMMDRSQSCGRRGFTLVETLTAVTMVTIVLGMCAVSIQLMMRLGGDGRARATAARSFGRLARSLRADAHACVNVKRLDNSQLELDMGDGRAVAYRTGLESVTRDESAAGKPVRHESLALGKGKSAAFARRDDGPRSFLALSVSSAGPAGSGPSLGPAPPARPIEVLALIGKDHREASRMTAAGTKGGPEPAKGGPKP